MTEEVMVFVRGLHSTGEGFDEPIELVSHGTYQYENGNHLIQYEEVDEEEQQITKVSVVANESHVEIKKKGFNNVDMIFQGEQKTSSCYQTPYGDLEIGIHTSEIRVTEYEDRMEILLAYGLDMDNRHVADCSIEMKIVSKEVGN